MAIYALQKFDDKYNFTPEIPQEIPLLITKLKELAINPPEVFDYSGVRYLTKKVLLMAVAILEFYGLYKFNLTKFRNWYFKTPLSQKDNQIFGDWLKRRAPLCAEFEYQVKKVYKLVTEKTGAAGNVGAAQVIVIAVAVAAVLIVAFFQIPEIMKFWTYKSQREAEITEQEKIMRLFEAGKGATAGEYLNAKEKNTRINDVTNQQIEKTLKELSSGGGGGGGLSIYIIAAAAIGAIFLLKKK